MTTTVGKKFQNFLLFRFLIIMQNVNMVANGKRNTRARLNPEVGVCRRALSFHKFKLITCLRWRYHSCVIILKQSSSVFNGPLLLVLGLTYGFTSIMSMSSGVCQPQRSRRRSSIARDKVVEYILLPTHVMFLLMASQCQ